MPAEIEKIHKELEIIRKDMKFIKHILQENYELSVYAKKKLKNARKTPKSKYIDLDELD